LFAQGKYQEALPICINVRKVLTHTRGKEHSEVGIALDNLARVYAAINQREKAYKLYNKSLSIKEAAFGQNHTYVAMTLDHTASNRYAMLVDLGSEATPDDFVRSFLAVTLYCLQELTNSPSSNNRKV
jgi:tetratricopeptide (TPR) repeat protein